MTLLKIFNKGRVFSLYKLKGDTEMSPVMEKEIFEDHKYSINESKDCQGSSASLDLVWPYDCVWPMEC